MSETGTVPRDTTRTTASWGANLGLLFGAGASLLLAGGGLLFQRPELVLIAVPVILSLALAWYRRPGGAPLVTVGTAIAPAGTRNAVRYDLGLDLPAGVDAVSLRLQARGLARYDLVVDADTAKRLTGEITLAHSGPQEVLRVDYSLLGAQGGFIASPAAGPRSRRIISPRMVALRRLPLPLRMFGLAGGHDSARPGDGGEFRDVSKFTPGDRLRRIDWKVTARRAQAPGDLYVRRSFATADATALLVLDNRDDVGELVSKWEQDAAHFDNPTSLDGAREAASAIASAYIKAGDRVGYQDLAGTNRVIAPGGGQRQLHRLLPAIARAEPLGAPRRRVRAPIVPAGAIVYVISTFLDDEAARLAELWRSSGHRVVAVDVLPPTPTAGLGREKHTALRIITMERQDRIAALHAVGVDLVEWYSDRGISPESQLSVLVRTSRRPR
ncbi:MAG TPA: DUF58 domain-containing protein [Galbitalea sp.]